jgi:hypothetical protein
LTATQDFGWVAVYLCVGMANPDRRDVVRFSGHAAPDYVRFVLSMGADRLPIRMGMPQA